MPRRTHRASRPDSGPGGGDEQEIAVVEAQGGELDEAAPDRTPPGQPVRLTGPERAEQLVQARHPVPTVGDAGVALEALVERDALLLQPAEPGP